MNKIILLFFLLLIGVADPFSQTMSYFSEESLDCTVLLEKKVDSLFIPHGTGYLLYDYTKKSTYNVVTCEHVLRNREIYICLPVDSIFAKKMREHGQSVIDFFGQKWLLSGNKLRARYELIPNKTFVTDKSLDIGVFSINISNKAFENDTTEVKVAKIKGIPKSMIITSDKVPLGIDVYFTGFPLMIGTEYGLYVKGFTGLFSDDIPNPLVRKGSVAWKSNNNNEFLLDALSYGGNSGSPIFTISDFQNKSYLIGMVLGHLPSEKSDNIGLARCIWMDDILGLVEKYDKIK